MADESTFYRNILENMTDGVMTLDLEGKIIMFNPAAARILGLARKEVLNRPFGEIFLMEMEGIDVFNQTILDAIYESKVGANLFLPACVRRFEGRQRRRYCGFQRYYRDAKAAGGAKGTQSEAAPSLS